MNFSTACDHLVRSRLSPTLRMAAECFRSLRREEEAQDLSGVFTLDRIYSSRIYSGANRSQGEHYGALASRRQRSEQRSYRGFLDFQGSGFLLQKAGKPPHRQRNIFSWIAGIRISNRKVR